MAAAAAAADAAKPDLLIMLHYMQVVKRPGIIRVKHIQFGLTENHSNGNRIINWDSI